MNMRLFLCAISPAQKNEQFVGFLVLGVRALSSQPCCPRLNESEASHENM